MKETINIITILLQGIIGFLIITDVWSVKAIAWFWLVSAAFVLLLLVIAATTAIAQEDE